MKAVTCEKQGTWWCCVNYTGYLGSEDVKITYNDDLLWTQNAPVRTTSAPAGIQIQDLWQAHTLHWSAKKFLFLLPVKIWGDSYSFDFADSEHDNQIAHHPPMLREVMKLKNYICNKK